jgi:membrane fusion protein (multidrug efflux system)
MDTRERQEPIPSTTTGANGLPRDVVQTAEVETAPPKPRNLRPVMFVIGALVLIAALFWGAKWYAYASTHQSTDDAHVDANIVAITSKLNERVDQILTDRDLPVHRGQLLIVLDSRTERDALAQARANLQLALENQSAGVTQGTGGIQQAQGDVQNASAQVPVAVAGVNSAQAQVQAARAAIPAAQQALNTARANYERALALVKTGDVAAQELDAQRAQYAQASSQYRSAEDQLNVAQANLNAAQQRVGAAEAGVIAAQGGVQTAQGKLSQAQAPAQIATQRAAVGIAQVNLNNTRIYAPVNGIVGERSVELGQTVSPGQTLLTVIPDRVFITANYKETQIGNMHPGQPVDITVDAYKGVTFHGTVDSLNPASENTYALVPAQNSTGNFVKVTQRVPAKIVFDKNTDFNRYPMRPGMSVETSVQIK